MLGDYRGKRWGLGEREKRNSLANSRDEDLGWWEVPFVTRRREGGRESGSGERGTRLTQVRGEQDGKHHGFGLGVLGEGDLSPLSSKRIYEERVAGIRRVGTVDTGMPKQGSRLLGKGNRKTQTRFMGVSRKPAGEKRRRGSHGAGRGNSSKEGLRVGRTKKDKILDDWAAPSKLYHTWGGKKTNVDTRERGRKRKEEKGQGFSRHVGWPRKSRLKGKRRGASKGLDPRSLTKNSSGVLWVGCE